MEDEDKKLREVYCFICGHKFIKGILSKHLKGCERRFIAEQDKKIKEPKLHCIEGIKIGPLPPPELQEVLKNQNCSDEKIQIYNERALLKFKNQSQPACKVCHRTFNNEAIKPHQSKCQVKPQTPVKDSESGSGPPLRRTNSYDCDFRRPRVLISTKRIADLQMEILVQDKSNSDKIEEPPQKPKDDIISKPRFVMCHVCGRQFGTSSLFIHQKQCIEKFVNEEKKKLNKADQRPVPELPQSIKEKYDLNTLSTWTNQQLEAFNSEIFQIYNTKALVPCLNCKRTFLPESLVKHQKGCRSKDPKNRSLSAPKPIQQLKQHRKPKTLSCYICGRQFGLTSLKIHQAQCIVRYKNEQSKKDIDQRKDLPQIPQKYVRMIEQQNWTMDLIEDFNSYMNEIYKGTVLEKCYNCGRTFFAQSLMKHAKHCVKKQSPSPSIKSESQLPKNTQPSPKLLQMQRVKSQKHVVQHIVQEKQEQSDDQSEGISKKITSLGDLNDAFVKQKSKKLQVHTSEQGKLDVQMVSSPIAKRKQTRKQPLPKFVKQTSVAKLVDVSHPSIGKLERVGEINIDHQLQKDSSLNTNMKKEDTTFPTPKNSGLKSSKSSANLKSPQMKNIPSTTKPLKVQFAINNQKDECENNQAVKIELIKCKFCDRKFQKNRLQKHIGLCPKKAAESQKKLDHPSVSFASIQALEVQLEKCRKCHKKVPKERIDKHYNICRGTLQLEVKESKPSMKISSPTTELNKAEFQKQQLEGATLASYSKCGKNSKSDRLQKHEPTCKAEPKRVNPAKVQKTSPIEYEKPSEGEEPIKREPKSEQIIIESKQQSKDVLKFIQQMTPNKIDNEIKMEMKSLRISKELKKDNKQPKNDKNKVNKTMVGRTSINSYQSSSKRNSVRLSQI